MMPCRLHIRISSLLVGTALLFSAGADGTGKARAQSFPATTLPASGGAAQTVVGMRVGPRVALVARPTDSNHAVTAVRFLLDGQTLIEAGPPGRFFWDTSNLRPGRHVVQVQAFSGERFVGLSAPLAVLVSPLADRNNQTSVELTFSTYEIDPRRANSVAAPRLPAAEPPRRDNSAAAPLFIEPASALAPSRPDDLRVEVFLNGVRQNFAPAARLASADELQSPQAAGGSRSNGRSSRRRRSRRHQGRRGVRLARTRTAPPRTVWMPVRPLLQRLGARMRWEPGSKTLLAELDTADGKRRIAVSTGRGAGREDGAAYTEVGGQQLQLPVPVRLADNAIMVPLSFCTQALNMRVAWRKQNRRVELFTERFAPLPPV